MSHDRYARYLTKLLQAITVRQQTISPSSKEFHQLAVYAVTVRRKMQKISLARREER